MLLGGDISVDSIKGKGSKFSIFITEMFISKKNSV
jgi:hypothetical protein